MYFGEAAVFGSKIAENAELRPLEPWQAAEFLAHVDKARANIEPYIPWAEMIVDEESARQFLQRYADRQAADEGRLYGSGWTANSSAVCCSGPSTPAGAASRSVSGWPRTPRGTG